MQYCASVQYMLMSVTSHYYYHCYYYYYYDYYYYYTHTDTHLTAFVRDYPGDPVPER